MRSWRKPILEGILAALFLIPSVNASQNPRSAKALHMKVNVNESFFKDSSQGLSRMKYKWKREGNSIILPVYETYVGNMISEEAFGPRGNSKWEKYDISEYMMEMSSENKYDFSSPKSTVESFIKAYDNHDPAAMLSCFSEEDYRYNPQFFGMMNDESNQKTARDIFYEGISALGKDSDLWINIQDGYDRISITPLGTFIDSRNGWKITSCKGKSDSWLKEKYHGKYLEKMIQLRKKMQEIISKKERSP